MPKRTTKKVAKNTKQKGVRSALKWLKPTTPAKGMLLFFIVFALAGGAYYAYKSSAASWTANATSFIDLFSTNISQDDHSSKGAMTVAKMNGVGGIGSGASGGRATARIWVNFQQNTPVFICTTARAPISTSTTYPSGLYMAEYITGDGLERFLGQQHFTINQSKNYAGFCSDPIIVPAGSHFLDTRLGVEGQTNSGLYVPYVVMKW